MNDLRRFLRGSIPPVKDDLVALGERLAAHDRHTLLTILADGRTDLHGGGPLRRVGHVHVGGLPTLPVAAAGRWILHILSDSELVDIRISHDVTIAQIRIKSKKFFVFFLGVSPTPYPRRARRDASRRRPRPKPLTPR